LRVTSRESVEGHMQRAVIASVESMQRAVIASVEGHIQRAVIASVEGHMQREC
jgi:hypothetical protein